VPVSPWSGGPVDADTLFGIASNSKAFTTAAIAMLVDDGKLKWDDPVTKYLPGFAVYDPYVTRELTVRDLVTHRSGLGLGAGDLMFWPDTNFTREQVLAGARYIRPETSLRSKYAYNNLMFIVAGEVVHAVAGKPWDDFIRERIFTPLGMTSSRISSATFKAGENVAWPHSRGWRLEGTLTPIDMTRDDTWAAAAGVKTSVNDLSKWVIAQLNSGKIDGSRKLFSEAQSKEMWSANTIIKITEPPAPLKDTKAKFSAYGLGWTMRDFHGRKLIGHGGALTGMLSQVALIPEERLGVIVLTNQEEGGAMSAIVNHIFDSYLNLQPTDWISAYKAARAETMKKAHAAEEKQSAERATNSKPSLPLASYAGAYEDGWYGKVVIVNEKGKLVLRMTRTPKMVGDIEHWHYDTFRVVFRDKTIPDAFLTFVLDNEGSIEQMTMVPTSDLADFSFDYQDLLFRPVKAAGAAASR
jgi:CubicO group peptidase (beta-lactamase class C family)